jgi:hypothetical protein
MKPAFQDNHLRVQTNLIPQEMSSIEVNEMARAITFYQKDGQYRCQSFFTSPRIGELNWIEGLEKSADVWFRSFELIGCNLLHVRCTGAEGNVRRLCEDPGFYRILREMSSTFTESIRSRKYLDPADSRERWNAIVSLDMRRYCLANYINLDGKKTRIDNIVVIGDRFVGLTSDGKAAMALLTPEIMEMGSGALEGSWMHDLNKLGRIDTLEPIPNSETSFLACIKNTVYEFNLRGEQLRFETLDQSVKKINCVDFNHVRSLLATSDGLYEVEVEELPNMVRAASLPRLISHPDLKGGFTVGHYIEDPFVLGVHPAMGILAKTNSDRVVCF